MVSINIFNVLAGNNIDLIIPFFINITQLRKLLLLSLSQAIEIVKYNRCVLQWNVIWSCDSKVNKEKLLFQEFVNRTGTALGILNTNYIITGR